MSQSERRRSDSSSAVGGPSWVQPGLIAPTNVHITVQVLSDTVNARTRYQVEVADASTRELLALRSRPFHTGLTTKEAYEHASKWVQEALDTLGVGEPF